MRNTVKNYIDSLREKRSRQHHAAVLLVLLSLVVASATAWALHTTGESLTDGYCGTEEHAPTLSCYSSTYAENESASPTDAAQAEAGDSYITVTSAETVSSFYLWIFTDTTSGTKAAGFSQWDTEDGSGNFSASGITDAYTYTDTDNAVYYLVPIKYFTNVQDSLTGFTFDESNPGVCPFVYAPNPENTSTKNEAAYVYVEPNDSAESSTDKSGWYVRVQMTGSYDPPRSNIYYNPSNSFTLTYGSTNLTVNIVDTDGNPIYGDYSSFTKTLEAATKYVFGTDLAATQTGTAEKMDLPTISGYKYKTAYCNGNTSYEIVSLATKGYEDTSITGSKADNDFKAYTKEPIVAGGYYSTVTSVTLVYSVITTDFFTMTYDDSTITFKVVDTDGNPIMGFYNEVFVSDGKRYIFGAPSTESHDENENGDNKDKVEWTAAPDIDGYIYQRAYIGADDTADNAVFSLATKGYADSLSESGEITHLRLYQTEPMVTNQYTNVTASENLTITLVYKVKTDHFTLTLKDDSGAEVAALTVYVVDLSGNAISGDYQSYNQDLTVNTKYLFDPADSETDAINLKIPEIDGYTYYRTCYTSKNDHPVVSVVTQGYTLGANQGTLGKAFRFYNPGGTDANSGYHTCDSANIYLVYSTPMHVVTEVASANSTAVNLFDYWCTTRDGSDFHQSADDAGINADHALKFHYSSSDDVGTFNKWTGSNGGVLQGIVQNKLSSGFPTLSGNTSLGMTADDTESLDYLFDLSVENDYRASYRNVRGLFQINSGGYYYYNARENFAEFDEETNRFTLYEETGVADSDTNRLGMFFPFNTIEEAYPLSSGENATLNHYFGMAMTTRFIQTYEGHTDASRQTANSFRFAGDDDVWIFIDDVLVADLGGIHDAVGVTIDFAEGTVLVNNVYDGQSGTNSQTKTFSEIFEGTGVELGTYTNPNDGKKYTTLANNTTHTLKFFYLERGNAASNLYLEFNLNEIPDTAIYKVDQYGDPLEGATFAVYSSNEQSQYAVTTKNEDGTATTEYVSLASCTQVYSADSVTKNTYYIDPVTGEITANVDGKEYTIEAAYQGITDSSGSMPFVDGDNMYYSLAELQRMFGTYFLLQEIDVPDGYRTVSDTVLLTIQNDLLQLAGSTYETGVWTSPNAMVTATNTLYVVNKDDYYKVTTASDGSIQYYDPAGTESDAGTTNGSLFAVVLARGTRDAAAYDQWTPVTGNDLDGYDYQYTEAEEGKTYSNLADAIAAARSYNKNDDYGLNHVFTYAASGMQVTVEELPGEPSQYYTYLETLNEGKVEDAQYLVAYYYTTVDIAKQGWNAVNEENTARVTSHAATTTADATSRFIVQWGATIMVPNVENRLFVQKRDENNAAVNGAVFALYQVGEDTNGITTTTTNEDGTITTTTTYPMYYIAVDGTHIYLGQLGENNRGKAALSYDALSGDSAGTYSIAVNGVISVTIDGTTYTINPVDTATTAGATAEENTANQAGTGVFKTVSAGYYVVREVYVPAGYALNTAETKVLVNEDAVYANAGTSDNGVLVGNGVGYLVSTLDTFATEGSIDETLTWIYSVLRVNTDYDDFSELSLSNQQQYVKRSEKDNPGMGTDTTTDRSQAMVTYLVYDPSSENGYFDYRAALTQAARTAEKTITYEDLKGNSASVTLAANDGHNHIVTLEGEGTQRLYSDEGWTALEVYQDYFLGAARSAGYTEYTDLEDQNISNLFSNSTFILYTDKYSVGDLEISKTVLPADDTQGFTFTLTLSKGEDMITTMAESYYYTIYNVTTDVDGNETRERVTSNSEITVTDEDGITATYSGKIEITTTKGENDSITSQTGTATITLKDNQILVIEDLPYGTEYSVEETFTTPYTTWVTVNGGTSAEGRTTTGTLIWTEALNENNVWTVDYTNALVPLVQLVKVDSTNEKTTLAGAEFVMYRVVAKTDESGNPITDDDGNTVTVTQYYSSADGKWQELTDGKTESNYAMTTVDNGELLVANMNRAGTYYLKELAAPDGYDLLTEIIEFTVVWDNENSRFKIESPVKGAATSIYTVTNLTDDGQQLEMTVKNSPGYQLPMTGGAGTSMFTIGGLLLMTTALVYGCGRRRKRERRTK